MKLLQLDDSNSKRLAVKMVLRSIGVRDCDWFTSIEEGVEALEKAIREGDPYDAVISDMHYPIQKNGVADWKAGKYLIALLQEKEITVPVIILSTSRLRIENAWRTLWYDDRADWETELRTALQEIQREKARRNRG